MELRNDRRRLPRSAQRVLSAKGDAGGMGWSEEYWLSMSPDHREWVLWISWFDHDAGCVANSHAGSCPRTGVDRASAAFHLVREHWQRRRDLWDAGAPRASGGELLSGARLEALTERIWPPEPRTA